MKKVKREEKRKKKALLGNLKGFSEGIVRLFELATSPTSHSTSERIFQPYEGAVLDIREVQTFPEWKVQTDFRKLRFHQRKRLKQKVVYLQPIGPFPASVYRTVDGLNCALFQLLQSFMAAFFHGMVVRLLQTIMVDKLGCRTRIHADTKKMQLLVGDVLAFLKENLPCDGFCIVGITWVDLYPGDEWNFVLGEALCDDGCAVISFGHYEPQTYGKKVSQDVDTEDSRQSATDIKPNSALQHGENAELLQVCKDTNKSKKSVAVTVRNSCESNTAVQDGANAELSQGQYFEKSTKGAAATDSNTSKFNSSLQNEVNTELSQDGIGKSRENAAATVTDTSDFNSALKDGATAKLSGDILEKSESERVLTRDAKQHKALVPVELSDTQSELNKQRGTGDFEKFADLDRVDGRIIWRLFRGISHETCHITGMAHCAYYACAMNESKSVQQAERQPLFMCPVCLRKLQKAVGFDIVERYEALHVFFTSLCNGLSAFNQCADKLLRRGDVPDRASGNAYGAHSFSGAMTRFESVVAWLSSVLAFIRNNKD